MVKDWLGFAAALVAALLTALLVGGVLGPAAAQGPNQNGVVYEKDLGRPACCCTRA